MHRQLYRTAQPHSPRWFGDRPREHRAGGACPYQVVSQQVHEISLTSTNIQGRGVRALHKRASESRMDFDAQGWPPDPPVVTSQRTGAEAAINQAIRLPHPGAQWGWSTIRSGCIDSHVPSGDQCRWAFVDGLPAAETCEQVRRGMPVRTRNTIPLITDRWSFHRPPRCPSGGRCGSSRTPSAFARAPGSAPRPTSRQPDSRMIRRNGGLAVEAVAEVAGRGAQAQCRRAEGG